MTAQNQSSGGLLKNKFNLGQNTKTLFQVLAQLPLTTILKGTKLLSLWMEYPSYPLVASGSQEIRKCPGSAENAWNQREVPSWPSQMKILTIAPENCEKSPLKHFTETPVCLILRICLQCSVQDCLHRKFSNVYRKKNICV